MTDTGVGEEPTQGGLSTAELQEFLSRLRATGVGDAADSAELVDRLGLLEQVKGAVAGAQVAAAVALADCERARDEAAGVPERRRGQAAGALIGFACRVSPWAGARRLSLARALNDDLPRTMRALRRGEISEWRATIVVRETSALDADRRKRVDAEIAAEIGRLGDRKLQAAVARAAYRADPATFVKRRAKAESDRRVTIRPAPDAMTYLTGLLPVAQGVAAYAALDRHAKSLRVGGDPRSHGQIMSDTMTERLTGQARACDVPVEVNVTMDAETLFTGGDEPATMAGYGPIPADLARDLATGCPSGTEGTSGHGVGRARRARGQAWIRRFFTTRGGQLVAMDSRRRVFDGAIRDLIAARDQLCRTPYCNAPIRHVDHAIPRRDGGPTSVGNGQGLCEQCNYIKDHPGWRTEVIDDGMTPGRGPQRIRTTLPTGHAYDSTAPPVAPDLSFTERRLRIALGAHAPPPDILAG